MNVLLKISDFNVSKTFFLEKKPNMIMDGYFTKSVFSNDCMSMNGIFIDLPMQISNINKYNNKNVLEFDFATNKEVIQKICSIEKQLIQYYMNFFGISNKSPNYILKTQLQNGSIKYYKDIQKINAKQLYYIKLSGIWETHYEIGITFKIIEY